MNNLFDKLSKINVNEHTENKNGLTYLSWVWGWSKIKEQCPDANYEIEKFENNLPYTYDENTGYMVFTKVTIENQTYEMWLPVMDGNNKAMLNHSYTYLVKVYKDGQFTGEYKEKQVEPASMFDINKTIMRCLVKNIAMFGLGIYIYAGEDLPEGYEISKEEAEKIILSFGKYAGKTLKEINEIDVGYLKWAIGAEQTKQSLKDAIAKVLDTPNKEEQQERLQLIEEIQGLSILKSIDLEEVKTKFKVDDLTKMTTEQMKKCITAMQKK